MRDSFCLQLQHLTFTPPLVLAQQDCAGVQSWWVPSPAWRASGQAGGHSGAAREWISPRTSAATQRKGKQRETDDTSVPLAALGVRRS